MLTHWSEAHKSSNYEKTGGRKSHWTVPLLQLLKEKHKMQASQGPQGGRSYHLLCLVVCHAVDPDGVDPGPGVVLPVEHGDPHHVGHQHRLLIETGSQAQR